MTQTDPAIVVNAYNRPQALARLLASLSKADYLETARVPLVISVDHGGSQAVRTLAEQFQWRHGPKQLIFHEQHLGLLQHFFACGNLVQTHGAIVYLEDDLAVSPVFYTYATQALNCYASDERIAGISLYGLWFNGYTQQPFVPLSDGSDVFLVQTPYTQGLAFTASQWAAFAATHQAVEREGRPAAPLHELWSQFARDDWFPLFARYVISTDRFFVYPRVSLATGFGDAGAHFAKPTTFFQVPLQRSATEYRFKPLDEALAVYDSFFELLPDRLNRLTDRFRGFDYELDLYATKSRQNLRREYVLTSRRCRRPIFTFGKEMWPMEANAIEAVPGDGIVFCRTQDVRWDRLSQLVTWRNNYEFFSRGRTPGIQLALKFALAGSLRALGLVKRIPLTATVTEVRDQGVETRGMRELTP